MLRVMVNADLSALQRAWPVISQLISLLQVRLGNLGVSAKQRWQVLHLTRLAESLVRRWLMLKACSGEAWPVVRAKLSPPTPAKAGVHGQVSPAGIAARFGPWIPACAGIGGAAGRKPQTSRAPLFPLYEPERAVRFLDAAPETPGSPPPAFNPDNLKRRCAALSDVIAGPERHIKRMARWLARAAARCKTGPGRMHPLRVGWPPGGSRRQRRLDPERIGTLTWLDELARQAVLRGASP